MAKKSVYIYDKKDGTGLFEKMEQGFLNETCCMDIVYECCMDLSGEVAEMLNLLGNRCF